MMSGARLALLAASGLFVMGAATAQAADLGGDCCADLEERIAELEATTARKGNRKVSLTISGWVNEAVFFWDDGTESNVYVGTNDLERTRFKFAGEAKIADGWSAGYVIEIGIRANNSGNFSQDVPSTTTPPDLRHSYWFLKSKSLGRLAVGQTGMSTYHLLDDADGVNTRNYSDAEAATVAMGSFALRRNGAFINGTTAGNSLLWKDLTQGFANDTPGQSGRRNTVRYDSPEFAGFVATAAWGEDDIWDVKLAYKGEIGDFKLVGQIGYGESTDSNSTGAACSNLTPLDCQWWGVAGTIMHKPTGLYVYGGYGEQEVDAENGLTPTGAVLGADGTDTLWFVQAGIEKKFIDLGKTTIFGEYRSDDSGSNLGKNTGDPDGGGALTAASAYINNSDIDFWAAGVVQNIENAAMDLYVIYRHAEGDFVNGQGVSFNLDDFDMVISGARIQF
jgi:predicted porin